MNKNTIIGFIAIGAIMFGFSWYQSSKMKDQMEQNKQAQIEQIENNIIAAEQQKIDIVKALYDKLDVKRVEKVEDVVTVGDQVLVKVTEIDDQGRINLSRRDALVEVNGAVVEDDAEEDSNRKPRKNNNRRGFKKHD
mgnify:CR=1 FL=1